MYYIILLSKYIYFATVLVTGYIVIVNGFILNKITQYDLFQNFRLLLISLILGFIARYALKNHFRNRKLIKIPKEERKY